MQVPLLLLADYVNATAENKLNIMGVFANVNAPSFPFALPQMVLIAMFRASPAEHGEYNIKLELRAMDGHKIFGADGKLEIPEGGKFEEKNFAQVFYLQNVLFPTAGEYSLNALVNGELKQDLSLTVNEIKQPEEKQ